MNLALCCCFALYNELSPLTAFFFLLFPLEWTKIILVGFMLLNLLFYVSCFVDRCLSFCSFSFGHCVVCPSSIYGFWLPLWYIQTLFLMKLFTWVFWALYNYFWFLKYLNYWIQWLLFSTKWAIFFIYIMSRTMCILWDEDNDDDSFVLDQHGKFEFYCASMLLQFGANQYLLLHLNAACLVA